MVVPNFFALVASILVLFLYFRRDIPIKYEISQLKNPVEAIRDHSMFRRSWAVLAVLLAGYFVSEIVEVPVSLVAGTIAVFFLIIARQSL